MQITKTISVSQMLPKTFPTLFHSSLDLFIGQACCFTCSGHGLQMEKVGKKLGITALNRGGEWFSRTRDGRHRVWRSARHGLLTAWDVGDGSVVLKGNGQPGTECDGHHPEAGISGLAYFFVSLAEFRRFCAWRPLLLCTWNITKQPA